MAASPENQKLYARITDLMKGGMATRAACRQAAEEVGRPVASVSTTYYRMAAKDPQAPPRSSGRGRPRKTDNARPRAKAPKAAPAPAGDLASVLEQAAARVRALEAENAELRRRLDSVSSMLSAPVK